MVPASGGGSPSPGSGSGPRVSGHRCTREFTEQLKRLDGRASKLWYARMDAWKACGYPIPSTSPRIEFKTRDSRGFAIYGLAITRFYRAYCFVLKPELVALWYWVGNHPESGHIPSP